MGTVEETTKRSIIAKEISISLEGKVEGVMLGGTMGFGQNFSVRPESDIDLVVVIEKSKLNSLLKTPYFQDSLPKNSLHFFRTNQINMVWGTKIIDGVEVNGIVYEKDDYEDFCNIKGPLYSFTTKQPEDAYSYRFDGEKTLIKRFTREVRGGYIYEIPNLVDDKFYCRGTRQDFFYSRTVLYEKNNYFTNLEKNVWKNTIRQLVKEYGEDVDLSKYNVLNSHHVYAANRHRLPQSVQDSITQRTIDELEAYKIEIKNRKNNS